MSTTEPSIIDLAKSGTGIPNDDGPDKPPKRGPGRPKGSVSSRAPKRQTPLPPWKDGVISSWAENLYTTAGRMVSAFDPNYGTVLQGIAQPAGQAWENLAKDSPQLRRVFHALMTTTKMSELIMAHVPLFILVMHKHGPMRDTFDKYGKRFAEEMAEQMVTPDGYVVDDE